MERSHIEAIQGGFRQRFGAFIRESINGSHRARQGSGALFPRSLIREGGALGLIRHGVATSLGGEGASWHQLCLGIEEMAYLCPEAGVPALFTIPATVLAAQAGREGFLGRLEGEIGPWLAGERYIAFAFTDTGDVFDFATTARPSGPDWVVNGHKPIIMYGSQADAFLVYARHHESPDLMAFLVRAADPGVTVKPVPVMGFDSVGCAALTFEDVAVPAERVVFDHDGLATAFAFLSRRRLLHACEVIGAMRGALENSIRLLKQKVRYKRRVADFQSVQLSIGRAYMGLESARAMVYRALADIAEGRTGSGAETVASVAKYCAVEQAMQLGRILIDVHGTEGYLEEHGVARYLRDVPAFAISSTTQQKLEVDMGEWVISEFERRHALA